MDNSIQILHEDLLALRRENQVAHDAIFDKLDKSQGCLVNVEKEISRHDTRLQCFENVCIWLKGNRKTPFIIFSIAMLISGAVGGVVGANGIAPIVVFIARILTRIF